MRTTLTIDDDLWERIVRIRKRMDQSLRQVIHEALREGLAIGLGLELAPGHGDFVRFAGLRGLDPLGRTRIEKARSAPGSQRRQASTRSKSLATPGESRVRM